MWEKIYYTVKILDYIRSQISKTPLTFTLTFMTSLWLTTNYKDWGKNLGFSLDVFYNKKSCKHWGPTVIDNVTYHRIHPALRPRAPRHIEILMAHQQQ